MGLLQQYQNLKRKTALLFLKSKDFSIISNNCWGGFVYQHYNLPYQSPFAGLFLFAEDFIKLLGDIKGYMESDMTFIPALDSKYKDDLLEWGAYDSYPIGKIKDIEIHFLHYKTNEEAADKWKRRAARINYSNLIIKFSDRDGCTEEMIAAFDKMNYTRKVCITTKAYPYKSCYRLQHCKEDIPKDEWAEFIKDTRVTKFINRFY